MNIGDNLKFISYISGKNKPTLAKLCTLLKAKWEIANLFKVMVFVKKSYVFLALCVCGQKLKVPIMPIMYNHIGTREQNL